VEPGLNTSFFKRHLLTEELCPLLNEALIANIELLDWYWEDQEFFKHDLGPSYFATLASYGIKVVSAHPRFRDFSSPNERVRERALKYAREDIDDTAKVPGRRPLAIFHPGGIFEDEAERPGRFRNSVECLKQVVEYSQERRVDVVIENMHQSPCMIGDTPEELMELIDAIGDDAVGVCVDVGHAHITAGVGRWLDACRQRLRHVHVHDNHGRTGPTITDEHLFPGLGTVCWTDLFSQLDSIGYRGTFLYEVRADAAPYADLKSSLEYLREFFDTRGRCADKLPKGVH